jgi:hypothetical protein
MKTYIIAGNSEQARHWLREKEYYTGFAYRPNDFQIVVSVDNLRGIENPSGVFVGTWHQREDIVDILHVLQSRMRKTNDGVLKAIQVYGEYNAR